MKNDTTTTVLNFVLAALVVLGVIFALLTMQRQREQRALTLQAAYANNALAKIQALANDTAAYNSQVRNPDLARLLQSIQAKPAAR